MLRPLKRSGDTYTFFVPSILSHTDQAHAQGWREFEKILRRAVWWFGAAEVAQLLKEVVKESKRAALINKSMLAEYHAAEREAAPKRVNKTRLASDLCKKYALQSPQAVIRQLDRLLLEERRKARAKEKALKKRNKNQDKI